MTAMCNQETAGECTTDDVAPKELGEWKCKAYRNDIQLKKVKYRDQKGFEKQQEVYQRRTV